MQGMFWLAILAFAAVIAWFVWHSRRKLAALRQAEEERFAAFMAQSTGRAAPVAGADADTPPVAAQAAATSPPAPANGLAQQKLLFEAAHKAGEAGEPALAFQLYARLLSRYPESAFAPQARAAAQAQKRKLSKG